MDKQLTVLLIEDSSSYAELVQRWLSGAGEEIKFVLNWTDSLGAGLNRLAQGGVDVILLDLTLPDSHGVETFNRVRAHAPKVPVIVLSSADSESLALQMIQEGAEDYLVKSVCDAGGLVRAARYAVVRHNSPQRIAAKETQGANRVIYVIGAKGGVGTTTIACNLAAALREQSEQRVLLADLDGNGGLASFLSGVESKYSLGDAVANLQRLDRSFWDSLVTHVVTQGPNDLHIIASPATLVDDLAPESLRQILAFARPLYDWTVVDLGRLSGASMRLLDPAGEMIVVSTLGVPALYSAKRVIDTLQMAFGSNRIRLVVNHIEEAQPLSRRELNSMFGIPVCAMVPSGREELHEACVQRKLPGKGSKIHKEIGDLARRITGLPEPAQKRNMPSLLSFAGKFRKTGEPATVSKAG